MEGINDIVVAIGRLELKLTPLVHNINRMCHLICAKITLYKIEPTRLPKKMIALLDSTINHGATTVDSTTKLTPFLWLRSHIDCFYLL